ncbi:flagellar hook-length control protein FliK [Virgibacillus byunsanensis]|uniref:Flagellar hook-length control protein FliK n=1 Tax=Virgibacillus byunsanensis TaxID=570945 RepID=A0ABW3LKE6_9BACI
MNVVGMLFQQMVQPTEALPNKPSKELLTDGANVFQNLLGDMRSSTDEDGMEPSELMTSLSEMPDDLQNILLQLLSGSKGLEQLVNDKEIDGEVLLKVEQLLENNNFTKEAGFQKLEEMLRKMLEETNSTAFTTGSSVASIFQLSTDSQLNESEIQKQFAAIYAKVESILSKVSNQQNVQKMAPQLLKLMQQWVSLEKRSTTNQQVGTSQLDISKSDGTKEQAVWRELVQAFQKRNQFVAKQQYNTNATVTSTDVSKWLQRALNGQNKNQLQSEKVAGQGISFSTMPMSRVEQYVIHINQTQNAPSADQQLMEQFQKVMKTSKFLSMNNGTNQLSIALRPENLGEMMVKLTQINGEMTVKIMVSSHAAKEMLESNLSQLKNMFSPHQVVVEKQELSSQQTQQDLNKEQEEQALNKEDQGSSHQSEDNDDQKDEDDFETQFHELLMNEKV